MYPQEDSGDLCLRLGFECSWPSHNLSHPGLGFRVLRISGLHRIQVEPGCCVAGSAGLMVAPTGPVSKLQPKLPISKLPSIWLAGINFGKHPKGGRLANTEPLPDHKSLDPVITVNTTHPKSQILGPKLCALLLTPVIADAGVGMLGPQLCE